MQKAKENLDWLLRERDDLLNELRAIHTRAKEIEARIERLQPSGFLSNTGDIVKARAALKQAEEDFACAHLPKFPISLHGRAVQATVIKVTPKQVTVRCSNEARQVVKLHRMGPPPWGWIYKMEDMEKAIYAWAKGEHHEP